jgi:hypothetical protein
MTSKSSQDDSSTTHYSCKWGKITILNGNNFQEFKRTAKAALIYGECWDIANGQELRPQGAAGGAAAGRDWDARARRALLILYNSVASSIQPSLDQYQDNIDPAGMWTKLQNYDRTRDAIYLSTLRQNFYREVFSPKSETVQAFADKLQAYRPSLDDLTDDSIKERLFQALPDEPLWQQARHFCLGNNKDLFASVSHLQTCETTRGSGSGTAAAANIARGGRDRGRGNYRGRGRGAHRGRDRGRNFESDRESRKWNNSKSGNRVSKNQCAFCLKEGHWMKDCRAFKRAQESAQSGGSSKNSKNDEEVDSYLPVALAVDTTNREWIVDSGATHHFTGNQSDFKSIKRWNSPKSVSTAGGDVESYGQGNVDVKTPQGIMQLKSVWFVPEFECRLISTSKLNDDGLSILLENHKVRISKNGETIFEGNETNGVYPLKPNAYPTIGEPGQTKQLREPATSWRELWHRRLGHINYPDVDRMLNLSNGVHQFKSGQTQNPPGDHACEECLAGRMKESFQKITDSRTDVKIRRLHMDISGIKSTSIQGYYYFVLITDDATRMSWIHFTKTKSAPEVFPLLKEIKLRVELETGLKVVFVRADNGKGEFSQTFQDHLKENGIQFEPSPAYKHSLNGVIERAMQDVNKLIRTLLYQAKLPETWWDYAATHAVWIKNRTPTSALPYKSMDAATAFEAYYDKKPDVKNLRVFWLRGIPINTSRDTSEEI